MLTYFKVSNRIQELRKDIRGATAIEYALIAAAIALVIIVSLGVVGDDLTALFTKVSTGLNK